MSLLVTVVGGKPSITYTTNSTDTAALLSTSATLESVGDHPKQANSAVITIEDENIRYAFGVTPVKNGAGELGHPAGDGDVIKLNSYKALKDFKFVSAVAGSHAKLMVTIGF